MQRLEVSGAVRHIYVIRRLKVNRKFVTELLTNQTTVHDKSNNSKERKNTAYRPRPYGAIWCAVGGASVIIAKTFFSKHRKISQRCKNNKQRTRS
jgi:hypothetical protein